MVFKNRWIHDALVPSPSNVLHQILYTMNKHILARNDKLLPSLWTPPLPGYIKGNLDVAIRGSSSAVVAPTISDSSGSIIMAATQKSFSSNVLLGEAGFCLLPGQLSSWVLTILLFIGDALLVILAIFF